MIKLVGGHNFFQVFIIYLVLIFSKNIYSIEIYDYHTEKFISKINNEITSVNSYDKKINFKIYKDDFPNAYVTEDNTIYLSSGLLMHSPDYVSLLGVLAHEIGHIEKFHIAKRKNEITSLKNISSIGNIAAIFGSMLIQNPNLINAIVVNQTSINNLFINFSQEQEIEADFYAMETINNLNLPKNSIKEFLILVCKSIIRSKLPKLFFEALFFANKRCHHLKPKYFKPKSTVSNLILYSLNFPLKWFVWAPK